MLCLVCYRFCAAYETEWNSMSEKILVVDDDVDSLKLIGLMLQRNGYQVVTASSGSQALSRAANETPDLIILDVMMPDMDGYEVSRRLRSNKATQHVPIIMFTAKTLLDDKVAGFEAGADDYLTKPTHPAELASRVKAILARSGGSNPKTIKRGVTIGFLGTKGGVGTTTLAVNIAAARLLGGENPILADFCLGRSSMGITLGLARANGMARLLARASDQLTSRIIEDQLTTHPSGLKLLLSSPQVAETAIVYSQETASNIIQVLRTLGSPVIADLGAGLTPSTFHLQSEMDMLVLVIDPTFPTLHMAREILQELERSTNDPARIHLVIVNRAASSSTTSWREVEQLMGREVRGVISLASELIAQALQSNVPATMYQPTLSPAAK